MSDCNNEILKTTVLDCSVLCDEPTPLPIAQFSYDNFVLTDASIYSDGGGIRQIRWVVFVDDFIIYNFGYNVSTDVIVEFSNGSTYDELDMGNNNSDMISFLESLPNTIIPSQQTIYIKIDVIDSQNRKNNNKSNIYGFTKI